MPDETDIARTIDAQDVELIRLVFVNNSGVPRGRVLGAGEIESVLSDGANLTKGMQSFNALDALVSGGTFGPVGEIRLVPDPETFTVLPYADRTAVMLCDMHDLDGTPWDADPRSRLRAFLADLDDDGLVPKSAFEGEYYLTREGEDGLEPFDDSTCFAVDGMDSAHDVVLDTIDALKDQGLGLSNYYPEYGPGQQELVIEHDEGVAPADNHVLYKSTVNAIASEHGVGATFAPQPFDGMPGSGCHVHLSLWRDGENAFAASDAGDGSRYGLSEFGRQFVAGVLEHAPALVALTAPTVQSYDRLQPGMWASAFTAWGHDNREACVRVPSSDWGDQSGTTRIEYKSCDNTANPYLALLGLLAAGMDGVERGLDPGEPLQQDPGALSEEARADRGIERLPASLAAALDAFEDSQVLRDALGETLHQSYLEVKRSEWEASTDEDGEWEADYLLRAF